MKRILLYLGILLLTMLSARAGEYKAYLFAYFTGNDKAGEAIRFAISYDGYNYRALNDNRPVIASEGISSTGGVRDPHILRGEDGKTFYMVVTDMESAKGWDSNRAMVLLKSTDLVHWSSSVVNMQKKGFAGYDDLKRVWAPQTIYDAKAGKYMIYWSMKFGDGPDRIYYAYANPDFTDIEGEPKHLFLPASGKSCIDGDIVRHGGKYHLFYKTEGHGNGIKKAVTKSLTSGKWKEYDEYLQQTDQAVEGSSVFPLIGTDKYILMYDVYMAGKYQFTESADLTHFRVIDGEVSMDFHPRHGTVIPITVDEAERLEQKWGNARARTAYRIYEPENGNPVIKGFYADPAVLYSHLTGRYYIYPTTDGYPGWGGSSFKAFSSCDLKEWKDEGIILDLPSQVKWAKRNAWAPCIIEKKVNGKYKYFYYYTAAQQIGVAVADHPAGPFKAGGRAVVDKLPDGVGGGQNIDPDVFADPVSGKTYLYWGNGFMAVAELSGDMMSIRPETIRVITPEDGTFREGTCVFFRNGKYYFLWSEDDTRSENYRVRYGIADTPTGPVRISENNLILAKNPAQGIYGTGHNSVLQIPGKDEWYIVYHRFYRPDGIKMGDAAGYHREVCIDRMTFDKDGTIQRVVPTLEGTGMNTRKLLVLDSIRLSDPCILADPETQMYYMTGTGGMLWKSKDLKWWDGPYRVTETDPGSWMGPDPEIWAAEIHAWQGKYYYFATFTNKKVKIDTVRGNAIERRASHVLVGDYPDGPYIPMRDSVYLPAAKPTLDGTFWVDRDGKPYMVYCHEWLQNWNGTIEKIELKPDLSGPVGEGKILFRASDSPWSREKNEQGEDVPNKVTDGPYLFRTGTGRLGMIWTSWVYDVYTQGVAYSESGTLDGPWVQEKEPVTPPDYGHGMLFQTFEGQWMMALHSHRNIGGHYLRIPHLFEVDLSGDKLVVKPLPDTVQAITPYEGWELVWNDEFDREGRLDEEYWGYEHGFQRNKEHQWYQPENAYCKDGLLVIEGRREQRPNPLYRPGSGDWRRSRPDIGYTSSSVNTRGKKEFQYGRFEVRAKIPVAGGAWPAIWTLGTSMEWPSCGEIDVMEYYRIGGVPHILANAAWGKDSTWDAEWNSAKIPFQHFLDKDPRWAEKFHVWRMDWDEEAVRLYLDGELLNEILLSSTVNGSLGQYRNPFRQPHYLLLNLAVGGMNGGTIDDTAFPMRYEIDYVRVYQKKK